jgi:hypothetical protein
MLALFRTAEAHSEDVRNTLIVQYDINVKQTQLMKYFIQLTVPLYFTSRKFRQKGAH